MPPASDPDLAPGAPEAAAMAALGQQLQAWGRELGFSQIGVADIDLRSAEPGLQAWLAAGFHGSMHFMAAHGLKRARPAELWPGTVRVVTARMDYRPGPVGSDPTRDLDAGWRERERARLDDPGAAVVSIYARGRDYHKVMRQRLLRLAERLGAALGPIGHRVFCDSAPVLEVELASRSALGWRGKHTLLIERDAGSLFFLGEIFVTAPLPVSVPAGSPAADHCGRCRACLEVCPTGAIVAPWRLDARRCISYLTIEHDGPIEPALRPALGNRIYGCDDCQLVCPWNKFARVSPVPDFAPREGLDHATLLTLWAWDESAFLRRTEGSPIRRIGWQRWRRNLAVALGNALASPAAPLPLRASIQTVLGAALAVEGDPLVAEHLAWALARTGAADQLPCKAEKAISASGTLSMPSSVEVVTRPAT